jgi:hypothetical protein
VTGTDTEGIAGNAVGGRTALGTTTPGSGMLTWTGSGAAGMVPG